MIQSAVIGAGQVARQHLACLSGLPGVRLVGICDLSRALAESSAERYGVQSWFTDHARMLAEVRPDVVHITTPPSSHFRLAKDCLNAGAHVFVEKPATARLEEFVELASLAQARSKWLVEDYNYLFNEPVRRLRTWAQQGVLGDIVHAEAVLCLNILEKDNPFSDPNVRHPALNLEGGAITDFLPHLASLAYFFCGPVLATRTVWDKRAAASPLPFDEFRAVLRCERATASLLFSGHAQPDTFRFTLFGTKGRATVDIYENRLTYSWLRPAPKPLVPFLNVLGEAKVMRSSAWKLLWQKLGAGPGSYEGLWALTRQMYERLAAGEAPPYTIQDIHEVNRLVDELKKEGNRI